MMLIRYKLEYILIVIAFIVSVLMRFYFIDARELSLDETYTTFLLSNSFEKMMYFIKGDVHPPLYYICLKIWAESFGYAPHVLRLFSLLINCLLSIVLFFACKRLFKQTWTVIFCSLLIFFSPQLFYHSVEVRPYMFATLFLGISFYFYVRIIDSTEFRWIYCIAFSVFAALGFYSHYFTLFVILSIFVHYLVYSVQSKDGMKRFLITILLFVVAIGPWIPTLIHQRNQKINVSSAIRIAEKQSDTLNYGYNLFPEYSFKEYAVRVYRYINGFLGQTDIINTGSFVETWILRVMKIFLLAAIALSIFQKNKMVYLYAMICVVYISAIFMVSKFRFVSRYFLFLNMFIIFWIGAAVENFQQRFKMNGLVVAICLLVSFSFILGSKETYSREYCKPFTNSVKYIKDNYKKSDVVILSDLMLQVPFDYYSKLYQFAPNEISFPINIYEWWDKNAYKGWSGPIIKRRELVEFVEKIVQDRGIERIWLVSSKVPAYDPGHILRNELSERFNKVEKCEYYESSGQCEAEVIVHLLCNSDKGPPP